jgi:uncharacterized membrane protein YjjP (DUF1212 family)
VPDRVSHLDPTLDLASQAAALLLENGQTTEGTNLAVGSIGATAGTETQLFVTWGQLLVTSPSDHGSAHVAAALTGIDIGRVAATERVLDQVVQRTITFPAALESLHAIRSRPPVSVMRLSVMAGLGAAALALIFGASDVLTLVLVALSACLGGFLRRGVSHLNNNPFLQPFAASALAGVIASVCMAWDLPIASRLLAVCPCMVLVPGPHVLNGSMDLVRVRILLGIARLAFASLVVLAICTGLLLGLAMGGATLEPGGPTPVVPFVYDVCAAGVAVAAYGAFFNLPWRMLFLPIGIGMMAHALRWTLLLSGFSVQAGALAACLLVGILVSPLAYRLRIPFGALAFASVVSMMPGVYLFQAASQAIALAGPHPSDVTALSLLQNGITAFLIVGAMTVGLIVPKLVMDQVMKHLRPAGNRADAGAM